MLLRKIPLNIYSKTPLFRSPLNSNSHFILIFCPFLNGFKDRQQEARAVLVGSRYIGDYYMILELQYMYYIPITTLLSALFIGIKNVKFTGPETKRA